MIMPKVAIIIPFFNEAGNINAMTERMKTVFESLPKIEFKIIFVDDGSSDESLPILMSLSAKNPNIFHLSLSRSSGKDNALIDCSI